MKSAPLLFQTKFNSMQAHSPKGFSPLDLGVDTGDDGQSLPLYRTLPRPGPLLLRGVLARLDNHPPHMQLTIMPGAGHTGRTDRVGEESTRVQLQPILWRHQGGRMCLCVPIMLSGGLFLKGGLEWVSELVGGPG